MFAVVGHLAARRGVTTLRFAHGTSTDSASTNCVATDHGESFLSTYPACIRPRAMIAAAQISPSATVNRSRLRSATDEPPTEDDTPPPNMSEMPPPLPLCISTNRISNRLVMTSRIENASSTVVSLVLPQRRRQ